MMRTAVSGSAALLGTFVYVWLAFAHFFIQMLTAVADDGTLRDHGLHAGCAEFGGFFQQPLKGLGLDHGRQEMDLVLAGLMLLLRMGLNADESFAESDDFSNGHAPRPIKDLDLVTHLPAQHS